MCAHCAAAGYRRAGWGDNCGDDAAGDHTDVAQGWLSVEHGHSVALRVDDVLDTLVHVCSSRFAVDARHKRGVVAVSTWRMEATTERHSCAAANRDGRLQYWCTSQAQYMFRHV
jgi:hypothetical protein